MPFIALGPCFRCGKMFTCNPDLVLVVTITSENTPDQSMWGTGPLCEKCLKEINEFRVREMGLPEWDVDPRAYKASEGY